MNRETTRLSAACVLTVALLAISGCAADEPAQLPATEPAVSEPEPSRPPSPPPSPLPPTPLPARPADSPPPLEVENEVTAWDEEFKGLIRGFDGELYEPYNAVTVERVQTALRNRGLYAGPANGLLGKATMQAILAFQEANYNLQLCGIPTPRTRAMLEQGSHTDPVR